MIPRVTWLRPFLPRVAVLACLFGLWPAVAGLDAAPRARRVEVLASVGGLPPHIVGLFRDAAGFQQTADGQYFVFDRRSHAVYGVDAAMTGAWKIVDIGQEQGRLIDPTAFDSESRGTFVVADAPGRAERVQLFEKGGRPFGGFNLPGRATARITLGSLVLSGIGSLQYTGRSLLMSQPETGALITEYGLGGTPVRSIGVLRPSGQEHDRALHLALNAGLPLVNPQGGFYFVFQAGVPVFRKYDAAGTLVFERHIEGIELDPVVRQLPTAWPRRQSDGGDVPLVAPTVRTAAVAPDGHLWISFMVPYTYVYDGDGEKTRVVQFKGAGLLQPSSLFFAGSTRLLVTPGCYEFNPSRAGRS